MQDGGTGNGTAVNWFKRCKVNWTDPKLQCGLLGAALFILGMNNVLVCNHLFPPIIAHINNSSNKSATVLFFKFAQIQVRWLNTTKTLHLLLPITNWGVAP